MATPTSAAIIAAATDDDLLRRLVALGATLDPPLTQAQIEAARTRLATAAADDEGATIASVYEYRLTRQPYRIGEDPSGITDTHLLHALNTLA